MTNDLVKTETGEIVRQGMSAEQIQLVKDTVAIGATDDELQLLFYQANKTGLDPLSKQIHLIKRWNSKLKKEVATIQTGIDGYRVIAERTGSYAGQDEPSFEYAKRGDRIPLSASVTVYRIIMNQRVGFAATAFYDEYVGLKKDGQPNSFWAKMPKGQLAKCAEALALRKAFPNDLSGIYTIEEMGQTNNPETPSTTTAYNPTTTETSEESNDAPDGSMHNPLKMKSRYDNGKCGFCGDKHLQKGDEIVGLKKDDGQGTWWGHPDCFKREILDKHSDSNNGDAPPPEEPHDVESVKHEDPDKFTKF